MNKKKLRIFISMFADSIEDVLEALVANWIYLMWVIFYVYLFAYLTGGLTRYLFIVTILLALSPTSEKVWRILSGVRPLRLKKEKERLFPLFKTVYLSAVKQNPNLSKKIRLYIKEDMSINAFAFGKNTLVLTRGSLELLNDECLKGLMAHEFGHFSHKHTEAILFATVGNLPMAFLTKLLTDIRNCINNNRQRLSFFAWLLLIPFDLIYFACKALELSGNIILMYSSRKNEYRADEFARHIGFGREITDALLEIYSTSISKPQSVWEMFNATHPHITSRIEKLERSL